MVPCGNRTHNATKRRRAVLGGNYLTNLIRCEIKNLTHLLTLFNSTLEWLKIKELLSCKFIFSHSKAVLIRVPNFIFKNLWCFFQNPPSKTQRSLFQRIFLTVVREVMFCYLVRGDLKNLGDSKYVFKHTKQLLTSVLSFSCQTS